MAKPHPLPDRDETTPTSAPASEQRTAPKMSFRDAMRLARAQRDPSQETAREEANELYGDDSELILRAIADGTHPQQRACDAADLEEAKQFAAKWLARPKTPDE